MARSTNLQYVQVYNGTLGWLIGCVDSENKARLLTPAELTEAVQELNAAPSDRITVGPYYRGAQR